MYKLLLFAGLAVWLGFTVWTVRWLNNASQRKASPIVFRVGVGGMGILGWILSIALGAKALLDHGGISDVWLKILFIAFVQLPVCLWAGYLFGLGMQAFANSMRT